MTFFRAMFFVAACSTTIAAHAATERFGGLSYELPADWVQEDRGGMRVLRPARLAGGEVVTVTLRAPKPVATKDAAAVLKADLVEGNADLVAVELEGEVAVQALNGGSLASQILVGEAPPWGRHYRWSNAYVVDGRAAGVVIVTRPAPLSQRFMPVFQGLLGSLQLMPAKPPSPAAGAPVVTGAATGKAPVGDTPQLFPGMPGWLPSGRGVPVPKTAIVDGRPQGVWWTEAGGGPVATYVFLADGSFFNLPRWGSGTLLDRDGQQRISPGSHGRVVLEGGRIALHRNGYDPRPAAYSVGSDASGTFFKVGAAFYRPLQPANPKDLVGRWKMASTQYEFHADGRFAFGQTTTGSEWMTSSMAGGRYFVDGWLLVLHFEGLHTTIESAGMANANLLHLGTRRLIRQP